MDVTDAQREVCARSGAAPDPPAAGCGARAPASAGLPPGWRFLIAPGHEDVWYDGSLLDPE